MVLDVIRGGRQVPGTNLRGAAPGASWLFALPTMELGTTVCLGAPSPAALLGLALRGRRVVVVEPSGRGVRVPRSAAACAVEVVRCTRDVEDGAAGLVVVGRGEAHALGRDAAAAAEVRRLLMPGGAVWADCGARRAAARISPVLARVSAGAVGTLWLTPSHGEVWTMVPADDPAGVAFVLAGAAARSVDLTEVKRSVRRFVLRAGRGRRQRTARLPTDRPAPDDRALPAPTGSRRRFGRIRGPAKGALDRAQRLVDRAERVVVGPGPLGGLGRRYGVVAAAGVAAAGPPRYLVDSAAAAGIDISASRWVLLAPRQYHSRKVVVLLFGPGQDDGLAAVVKLTRNPELNGRLENEGAALRFAADAGLDLAPRSLFAGIHAGLALLGTDAVRGLPFDAATSHRADCPYAARVIDRLADLGRRTARRDHHPSAIADAARDLVERFVSVYGSPKAERDALDALVTRLGGCGGVPTVLQHGDPGTWNVMVRSDGEVVLLDWEAAEAEGLPLLDLFYFVRTLALIAPDADLVSEHGRGFGRVFFGDTPLRALLIAATHRYRAEVGVPAEAVAPLFALCWVHRALREAPRLRAGRLDRGHSVTVLRQCLARPADLLDLLGPIESPTDRITH